MDMNISRTTIYVYKDELERAMPIIKRRGRTLSRWFRGEVRRLLEEEAKGKMNSIVDSSSNVCYNGDREE